MIDPGFGKDASVQVRIELPHGSLIHGSMGLGSPYYDGRPGECELSTGTVLATYWAPKLR